MKRHVQTTGIRNWAGDDLIELQSESLKVVDEFFGHFGPCIISGCEIENNEIKPGIVGLRGHDHEGEETYKVVPFQGAEAVEEFPVYLSLDYKLGEREYGDTQIKPIFYDYFAALSTTTPEEGEYFTVYETDNHLFVDAIQDPDHRFLTDEQVDKLTGIFHDNGKYTITGTDITLIATDGNIKFTASDTVILESENLEVTINDDIDITAQNNINLTAINGSTRVIANDTISAQVGDSELSVNEDINLEAEKNIGLHAKDGETNITATETITLSGKDVNVATTNNIEGQANNNLSLKADKNADLTAAETTTIKGKASTVSINDDINIEADKNLTLQAKAGKATLIANDAINVKGKQLDLSVNENANVTANKDINLKATTGNTDITAGDRVTVKGKNSSVTVNDNITVEADKNFSLQAKEGDAEFSATDSIHMDAETFNLTVIDLVDVQADNNITLNAKTGKVQTTAKESISNTVGSSSLSIDEDIKLEATKDISAQAKGGKAEISATDAVNIDGRNLNLTANDEVNMQADNNIILDAKTGKVHTTAKESVSTTVGGSSISVDDNIKLEATKDVTVQAKEGKTNISATEAVNIGGKSLNLEASDEVEIQANKDITLTAKTGKAQIIAQDTASTTVGSSSVSVNENINLEATKDISVQAKNGATTINATEDVIINGKNFNLATSNEVDIQASNTITLEAENGNTRIIAKDTASTTVGNSDISVNENITIEADKDLNLIAKNGKTTLTANDTVSINSKELEWNVDGDINLKAEKNISLEAKDGNTDITAADDVNIKSKNFNLTTNDEVDIEANNNISLNAKNAKVQITAKDTASTTVGNSSISVNESINLEADKVLSLRSKTGRTDITSVDAVNLQGKDLNVTASNNTDIQANKDITLNAQTGNAKFTAYDTATVTGKSSSITLNEDANIMASQSLNLEATNGKTGISANEAVFINANDSTITVKEDIDVIADKDINLQASKGKIYLGASDLIDLRSKSASLFTEEDINVLAGKNLSLQANNGITTITATEEVSMHGKDVTVTSDNNTALQGKNDVTIVAESGNTHIIADDTLFMSNGDSHLTINEDVAVGANKNLTIGAEKTAEITAGESIVVNADQSTLAINENIDITGNQNVNIEAINGETDIIGNKRTYISGDKSSVDITNNIDIQADNDIYIQGDREAEINANERIRLAVEDSDISIIKNNIQLTADGDIDINATRGEVTISANKFTSIDGGKSNVTVNDDIAIKADNNINFTAKELYLNGDKFVKNIQDSDHRFTTDEEISKLAGIEENANKYIHPTHPAHTSALYKITVDDKGHVTATTEATEVATDEDIENLNSEITAIKRDYLQLAGGAITGDLTVDGQLFYNGVQLNSSYNINTLTTTGNYYFPSGANVAGTLPNEHTSSASSSLIVVQLNSSAVYQIMYNSNDIYTRTVTEAGTVSAWFRHPKDSDLFSYLPLSGGRMAGTLTMADNPVYLGTTSSNSIYNNEAEGTILTTSSNKGLKLVNTSANGDITLTTNSKALYNGVEIATVDNTGSYTLDIDIVALNNLTSSSTREEIRELFHIPDETSDYVFFNTLYQRSAAIGKILTFQITTPGTGTPSGLIPVSFTRVTAGQAYEDKFHFSFIPYTVSPTTKTASLKRITLRIYRTNSTSNPGLLFEVAILDQYNNLEDYLPLSGGKMAGDISLNENRIRFGTSTAQNISFDATNNAIGINSEISGGIRVRSTVGDIQLITPNSNMATYNGNEIATLNDTSKYLPLAGGTVTGNLTVNGQFKFNSTQISAATWNIDEIVTEGDYYAAGSFNTTGTFPTDVSVTAFHLRVVRSASGWITQEMIVLNSTSATTRPRVFSRHIERNNSIVGEWIELVDTSYVNKLIDEVSGSISGIESALLSKQDKLEAGDNIKIEGKVISATDTVYDDKVLAGKVSANESAIAQKQDKLTAGKGIKLNGSNISVDITDDLITSDSNSVLSAKQGNILNNKFNNYLPLISNNVELSTQDGVLTYNGNTIATQEDIEAENYDVTWLNQLLPYTSETALSNILQNHNVTIEEIINAIENRKNFYTKQATIDDILYSDNTMYIPVLAGVAKYMSINRIISLTQTLISKKVIQTKDVVIRINSSNTIVGLEVNLSFSSLTTMASDITNIKNNKQDKLTAGTGITINGNTISGIGLTNNLTSTSTTTALTAYQGNLLNQKITVLENFTTVTSYIEENSEDISIPFGNYFLSIGKANDGFLAITGGGGGIIISPTAYITVKATFNGNYYPVLESTKFILPTNTGIHIMNGSYPNASIKHLDIQIIINNTIYEIKGSINSIIAQFTIKTTNIKE